MSTEPFIPELDREEDITLSALLDLKAREICGRIHTGMPAKIKSYNHLTQTCSVQPIVRGRFANGDTFVLPVLSNVPVQFPQGGGFAITWPLSSGDVVWLSFAERSLDEWKARDSADITPRVLRRFDLADAVAFAGLSSPSSPLVSASATDMVLGEDGPAGLRICIAAGKIAIGTVAVSLLGVLSTAFGAASTWATALATAWSATVTYAAAAGTAWTAVGQPAASTAAGVWGTAAGVAATACTTAATAFTTAQTAIDTIKK